MQTIVCMQTQKRKLFAWESKGTTRDAYFKNDFDYLKLAYVKCMNNVSLFSYALMKSMIEKYMFTQKDIKVKQKKTQLLIV